MRAPRDRLVGRSRRGTKSLVLLSWSVAACLALACIQPPRAISADAKGDVAAAPRPAADTPDAGSSADDALFPDRERRLIGAGPLSGADQIPEPNWLKGRLLVSNAQPPATGDTALDILCPESDCELFASVGRPPAGSIVLLLRPELARLVTEKVDSSTHDKTSIIVGTLAESASCLESLKSIEDALSHRADEYVVAINNKPLWACNTREEAVSEALGNVDKAISLLDGRVTFFGVEPVGELPDTAIRVQDLGASETATYLVTGADEFTSGVLDIIKAQRSHGYTLIDFDQETSPSEKLTTGTLSGAGLSHEYPWRVSFKKRVRILDFSQAVMQVEIEEVGTRRIESTYFHGVLFSKSTWDRASGVMTVEHDENEDGVFDHRAESHRDSRGVLTTTVRADRNFNGVYETVTTSTIFNKTRNTEIKHLDDSSKNKERVIRVEHFSGSNEFE